MSEPQVPQSPAGAAPDTEPPTTLRLTITQLSTLSRVRSDWLEARWRDGLLPPLDDAHPQAPRFDVCTIRRVQRMVRVERDFDAVPELAALVADLHDEIDRLRQALHLADR